MICVDGYKAFHGVMEITPKVKTVPPFLKKSDWLYKPEYDCWYCAEGNSYTANICKIVKDFTTLYDET